MKEWTVQLPGDQRVWLVSDDPDADLAALGFSAYALTRCCVPGVGLLMENPGYPVLVPPAASNGPESAETAPAQVPAQEEPHEPVQAREASEQLVPPSPVPGRGSLAGRSGSAPAPSRVAAPLGGKAAPAATVRRAQGPARVGSAEAGALPPREAPPPRWRGPARRCGAPVAGMGPRRSAPPAHTPQGGRACGAR